MEWVVMRSCRRVNIRLGQSMNEKIGFWSECVNSTLIRIDRMLIPVFFIYFIPTS